MAINAVQIDADANSAQQILTVIRELELPLVNGTFLVVLGGYLDRGKAPAASQDSGVLDRALRDLSQLVFHHFWRGVRHSRLKSNLPRNWADSLNSR